MSSILIACDGSSLRSLDGITGKGPIGWAWAREDEHWYANGHYIGTNQSAELLALMTALVMHPNDNIILQSDSKYSLNVAEKWMWGWAKKGWIKNDGQPIANLEIIKTIHHVIQNRNKSIDFVWVKGHDMTMANPLNHRADALATKTSAKVKDALKNGDLTSTFYSDSKQREHNPVEFKHVSNLLPSFDQSML